MFRAGSRSGRSLRSMHKGLTRYIYDKLKGGDYMNNALETLYKQWTESTESSEEYEEM